MIDRPEGMSDARPEISVRQIGVCLASIALVPPVLWALLSRSMQAWLTDNILLAESLWLSTTIVAVVSATLAALAGFLLFYRPMSVLRRTERQLRSLAMRDSLTGLLNRDGVRVALDHAIIRNLDAGKRLGVVLIDVDKFRLINSSLGETSADLLLVKLPNVSSPWYERPIFVDG